MAKFASTGLKGSREEISGLCTELSGVLAQPSVVSVGSGMGRPLEEYARGLLAGGTPTLTFAEADDHA